MKKALVYGYYNKGNVGDEFFKDAYRTLWPDIDFTFVASVTENDLIGVDVLFIGGGSFLWANPLLPANISTKIIYVSVGAETDIHPRHQQLMKQASLVAIRTPEFVAKVYDIVGDSSKILCIPDIVYSLRDGNKFENMFPNARKPKNILVLPNSECLPKASDPHWKHASWEHFKNEFAQALDVFYKEGYSIKLMSMCENTNMSDNWAGQEIVGRMDNRRSAFCTGHQVAQSYGLARIPFMTASVVVTQRLHGGVLAEMCGAPYVMLHHHDKLKTMDPCRGLKRSFYEVSKQSLVDAIKTAETQGLPGTSADSLRFSELRDKVRTIMAI